jgi:hypothetical protein
MTLRIVVVIPTRNRPELARRAVQSVLAQQEPAVAAVVLSDNSDDAALQQQLAAWSRDVAGLTYVKPPQPLNMGDHWDWVLGEALGRHAPTHLVVLTDRMVFRAGALAELAALGRRHPGAAIGFLADRINDLETPVQLERQRWSGALLKMSSRTILELTARCVLHTSLPRLLNALTPAPALARVRQAYGDLCRAVSPDFAFGYRYLATHPDFLYYDKALMVHYAIARSNGASATRGVLSPDAVNFRRATLGGQDRLPHTPYPEIMTLGNFVLEEYGHARAGSPAADLPDVDRHAYVKMLYHDITGLSDPAARLQQLELLQRRGHRGELRMRRLREAVKKNTQWLERGVKRLVRGERRAPRPHAFAGVDEALAWDGAHPAPRLADASHLAFLQPEVIEAAP